MMKSEDDVLNTRKHESSHAYNTTPIAALFEHCLQYFDKLISIMGKEDQWKSSFTNLDGCQSKFRQWSSDTGASDRSLDHALRKSSRLQQTTIDLLQDLLSTMSTTLDFLQESSRPLLTPFMQSSNDPFNHSDQLDSSRDSSDSEASIQQYTDEIEQIIDCLLKLVPSLQDPAPQDIYRQHASQRDASQDIALAAKYFPKATTELNRRLGYANWKRRQAFHHNPKPHTHQSENLAKTSDGGQHQNIDPNFKSITEILETDYRAEFLSHRTATGNTSITGPPSINDSVFSRPNYFSIRSASSISDSDQLVRLKIPKSPVTVTSDTKFEECPYCGQEIVFGVQIASNDDWAQHVFMDLEPYLCTFDDCIRADKSYGICDDWFQHELDSHRLGKVWFCHSCALEFDEKEHIEKHLRENHMDRIDASDLTDMVSLCERYSEKNVSDQRCPCCEHVSESLNTLKDHIADHLEQFALTSIQNFDEAERETRSHSIEDMTSVMDAKMRLIKEFITEQHISVWQPAHESFRDSTNDSNPAFADDSDEEFDRMVKKPEEVAKVTIPGPSIKRPVLQRRGDSWMTKVQSYLEKQTVERIEKGPWKTKVEKYLENQSVNNDLPMESNKAVLPQSSDPAASPLIPPFRPFRTKPPMKNLDFAGRDTDLKRLHEVLSEPGSLCILSGIGGMGKTAVANEYTYRYDSFYKYIFWVSAETSISCADTYSLIATQLVLPEDDSGMEEGRLITLSRDFLEQTEERWLLVFDNVNSWSDIKDCIPTDAFRTLGSILITSRKYELEGLKSSPEYHHVELGPLTLEESRQLLLLSMQPDLTPISIKSHPEYKLAGEIAALVENMPLALAHIAGYVQVSKCTLTEFVRLWDERHRYAGRASQNIISSNLSTHKVLETVWNIGLRDVTMDARELLNILAFLDSENIQRKLLAGEHEEASLEFLHADQVFRYKRMITELSRRRLIEVKVQDDEEILSIHRSLQWKILQDNNRNIRHLDEAFSQAFELVRKRFPLPSPIQVPEPSKWPACKEYLSHVLHLQHVAMELFPSLVPSVRLARLLSDGGINLWERGMTDEGLRLLRSAEEILDKLGCEESHLRANVHIIIALLIQDHGLIHVQESRDRIEKALQIRENYLKETDSSAYTRNDDILLHNARSDFGCVLLQYGKYAEAETIFQSCIAKYREWGSVRDIPYEYYKFNHHTAFCRLYHQDFATAIHLAEESLDCIILATGQSSATNKTRFDLACIILQSGDVPRALQLHREVLEWHLKLHGKFSFLTLQSYYAVGALSAYSGNLAEGERLMRDALSLEKSRPCSWPEEAVARTQFHLSQILTERGKEYEAEAQQLASQARKILERPIPLDPLTGVDAKDELALFDYIQPVFDGRFTGRSLLPYVAAKE